MHISGIICKAKYIEEEGYIPLISSVEVKEEDQVKGCSFWCNYQTEVIDSSGAITVSYGDFTAMFDDIIIIRNNGTVKEGWSGSSWRLIKEIS